MKKIASVCLVTLLLFVCAAAASASAQNTNSSTTAMTNANASAPKKKRGPIFRATKDQIKQAQAMLKTDGHYAGDATGKLDDATRTGLRKYQEAQTLKVTGTLNRVTLEKMGIALTDKQKTM